MLAFWNRHHLDKGCVPIALLLACMHELVMIPVLWDDNLLHHMHCICPPSRTRLGVAFHYPAMPFCVLMQA